MVIQQPKQPTPGEVIPVSRVTLLPDDTIPFPPDDLWSDEPPLESDLHRDQIDLLIRLIRWWFRPGGEGGRKQEPPRHPGTQRHRQQNPSVV